jgi:Protein of unknown function (DUF2974)
MIQNDILSRSLSLGTASLGLLNSASPAGLARSLLANIPAGEMTNWRGATSPVPAFSPSAASAPTVSAPTVDRRTLGLLASDVYNAQAVPPPGYRVASATDLRAIGLSASDLSSPNSTFAARVYVNGTGASAQYVVAFRGTQGGSDWLTNARQAVGASSDHYTKALAIGEKIALSGNNNVSLTGHSLGGGLASAAAIASGSNAVTFNAAGLSDSTIRSATQLRTQAGVAAAGNVDAYYVRGEVLSTLQDGGDRVLGLLLGGVIGAALADAPEAYGNRISLDAVRPSDVRWYQDNPVSRHGMNWVLSSLPN